MVKRLCLFLMVCITGASLSLAAVPARAADCVKVSNALSQDPNNKCIGSATQNPIFALIETIIQYLTGIIGIIMVLMIVVAGLQYVLSGTNPDVAKQAKQRLERAFTGLILFILLFGIMQVLLPPDVTIFHAPTP